MKHPALKKKLEQIEYDKLYRDYAGRYLVWSFSILLSLCAVVYLLVRPQWPTAVMVVLYCSGFVLCVSTSAIMGKRRARAVLKELDPSSVERRFSGD